MTRICSSCVANAVGLLLPDTRPSTEQSDDASRETLSVDELGYLAFLAGLPAPRVTPENLGQCIEAGAKLRRLCLYDDHAGLTASGRESLKDWSYSEPADDDASGPGGGA